MNVRAPIATLAGFAAIACGSSEGDVLSPLEAGTSDSSLVPADAGADVVDAASDRGADTNACVGVDFQTDPANCGRCGHDCQRGACVGGMCQPVLLATSNSPYSVVVDDTRVYWASVADPGGEIDSVAKDGSDPRVIATALHEPEGVFADAQNVFWTEVANGRVSVSDKSGGNSSSLFEAHAAGAFDIVVDANNVYWTDIYGGRVLKISRTGAPDGGTADVIASSQPYVFGIAQDANKIYWTTRGTYPLGTPPDAGGFVAGTVMSAPKDGSSPPEKLADGQADPRYVAVDDTAVYWCNLAGDTVMKLALGSSTPTVLLRAKEPFGIAVDATDVYVGTVGTDSADGTIVRMKKDGSGQPVILATKLSWPTKIAVDATAVYWGNVHGATVLKLAK